MVTPIHPAPRSTTRACRCGAPRRSRRNWLRTACRSRDRDPRLRRNASAGADRRRCARAAESSRGDHHPLEGRLTGRGATRPEQEPAWRRPRVIMTRPRQPSLRSRDIRKGLMLVLLSRTSKVNPGESCGHLASEDQNACKSRAACYHHPCHRDRRVRRICTAARPAADVINIAGFVRRHLSGLDPADFLGRSARPNELVRDAARIISLPSKWHIQLRSVASQRP